MNITNFSNEGTADRLLRLLLSEVFFLIAYFWIGGWWQIAFFVLAMVILSTAIFGFCGLYKIIGVNTCPIEKKSSPLYVKIIFGIIFILIATVGSYYSAFFTKKFFLDDYNQMNNFYKQTLLYTGQDKREEAMTNYNQLVTAYAHFETKYTSYHPYAIKSDSAFNANIKTVSEKITTLKEAVSTGDLKAAHLSFETIRPIFQDILKRNNFSILAVTLVDFHDAMEKIIAAADAEDAVGLLAVYPEVDTKLKAVEETANDVEIQAIRAKLEEVAALAKAGQTDTLSSKASELKSAFVKVYLKRG